MKRRAGWVLRGILAKDPVPVRTAGVWKDGIEAMVRVVWRGNSYALFPGEERALQSLLMTIFHAVEVS